MPEDSIRMQISQAESQIDSCSASIEELQRKINELNRIKPVVAGIKSEIGSQKTEVDMKILTQARWWGSRYSAYTDMAKGGLKVSFNTYYREVDFILDSINDAITRMENEILDQQGLIGKLKALCNSLWNELRNAFN